jgi:hypothetical protein
LRELTDKLRTVFEDLVVKSRCGYWLHERVFTTTPGNNRYRIPPRAVVGGLEAISINSVTNSAFYEIPEVPVNDMVTFEGTPGRLGQPVVYVVIGDVIELIPTPSTVFQIKMTYYVRPSQLVPQQSNSLSPFGILGLITAVNPTARTVTIAQIPYDQNTVNVLANNVQCDIVHPDGWHELSLVDSRATFTGGGPFTVTMGGTDDMSQVAVGDFLRAADQTDWPCLPDDFHRTLADVTAVKMLIELHLSEKAGLLATNAGNDVARFRNLLYPRVKSAPKQFGIMRRSRGMYPFGRIYG